MASGIHWNDEEDKRLISKIDENKNGNQLGPWRAVAAAYSTGGFNKSPASCRLRWENQLNPKLKHGKLTAEEMVIIRELHQKHGDKWSAIAKELNEQTEEILKQEMKRKELPTDNLVGYARTDNIIKNKFHGGKKTRGKKRKAGESHLPRDQGSIYEAEEHFAAAIPTAESPTPEALEATATSEESGHKVKKQRLRIIGPRPLNQLPPATPSPTLPQASQPASPEPANAQQADTTGIKALKIQFEEEADAATIILNQMLQRPAEPLTLLTAAEATPPASPQPADSEQTSQDWIEAMLSSFADESSQTTASDQLPPPIEKIPLVTDPGNSVFIDRPLLDTLRDGFDPDYRASMTPDSEMEEPWTSQQDLSFSLLSPPKEGADCKNLDIDSHWMEFCQLMAEPCPPEL